VTSYNNLNFQVKIDAIVEAADPRNFRTTKIGQLIGDHRKAKKKLGWVAEHDVASSVNCIM